MNIPTEKFYPICYTCHGPYVAKIVYRIPPATCLSKYSLPYIEYHCKNKCKDKYGEVRVEYRGKWGQK